MHALDVLKYVIHGHSTDFLKPSGGAAFRPVHTPPPHAWIADDEGELHSMADKLGLDRRWHQKPGTNHSHYDISLGYRAKAIKLGAIQISRGELGAMLRHKRELGRIGTPQEALGWLKKTRGSYDPLEQKQQSLF